MKIASTVTQCLLVGLIGLIAVGCGETADSGTTETSQENSDSPAQDRFEGPEPAPSGKGDIYGRDNRKEFFQSDNSTLRSVAKSTAMVVDRDNFEWPDSDDSNSSDRISFKKYDSGLCPDEPFSYQPILGYCTAFLVREDILVTAGHCIENQRECDNSAFAFGTYYQSARDNPSESSTANVYACDRVIEQKLDRPVDYAIVKVARPVENREPLDLRTKGIPNPGTPLGVVGAPKGLPLKLADGGKVLNITSEAEFEANLDIFGGNSGGPVVNLQNGLIEGIMVRESKNRYTEDEIGGETCKRWAQCDQVNNSSGTCYGNDVMASSYFADQIPRYRWVGKPCERGKNQCAGKQSGEPGICSRARDGYCTQTCERLCPDRKGESTTFCVKVQFETGTAGYCRIRCSDASDCRDGYACKQRSRHNQPSVEQKVCVPAND